MAHENEMWDDDSPPMQFHYAVSQADVKQVQDFLAQGMSADTKIDFGESLLGRAAYLGHIEIARLLLDRGADVNYNDDTGYTALKLAAEEGHLEMVRLLLDAGADMTICGGLDAGNPLHKAAQCGHVAVVRLLLERGADPNAPDMDGETVSYLQRLLFLEKRPEVTSQILALLKAAGATD